MKCGTLGWSSSSFIALGWAEGVGVDAALAALFA